MKKKITAIVLSLILLFSMMALAACSKGKDGGDKQLFVVGLDASFPPYGYEDDSGEIVGFDIDLAKEVAKRNNWEFKAQPIDWNSKDKEINAGTIDCIWNGFTMNGREEDYEWTTAYVDNSQVIVVKAESGIKTLADLAGKTVIVQLDSSAEAAINDDENSKMVEFKNSLKALDSVAEYNTAFLNLEAGAADAVAMDIGVAKYQIEERGSDKYIILDEQIAQEQYGVGFKLGNTQLRDAVQKTLDEMKADGTFQKTAETWGLTDSIIVN